MDRGILASNSEQRKLLTGLRDEAIGPSLLLEGQKKNSFKQSQLVKLGRFCSAVMFHLQGILGPTGGGHANFRAGMGPVDQGRSGLGSSQVEEWSV